MNDWRAKSSPASHLVILDPNAPSREDGFDAQQVCHLPGLEDAALRINQLKPLTLELESSGEMTRIENATTDGGEMAYLIQSRLSPLEIVGSGVHRG